MTKPKKSLGQNFFINNNLAKQIANIVEKNNPDVIVEIGPGEGYFSKLFSNSETDIIMIEKDDILAQNLSFLFPKNIIVNEDFLEWDFKELAKYKREKTTFFGSLPYNVSKHIIKKIVESEYFKNSAYFIIQKEVAQKYTEREPNNNLLSLRTQMLADTKKLFDIGPESFKPRPKVTSSFVEFSPTKKHVQVKDLIKFDEFTTDAFKQPRRKLSNNLKKYTFIVNDKTENLLEKRPQHLSLDDYIFLFSNIS